jgi:hypothetical protein
MDVEANDPAIVIASIADNKNKLLELQATSTNYRDKQRADNAMAALNELEKLYKKPSSIGEQMASSPTGAVEAIAHPANPNQPQENQPPAPPKGQAQENINPNAKTEMNTNNQTGLNNLTKSIRGKLGI